MMMIVIVICPSMTSVVVVVTTSLIPMLANVWKLKSSFDSLLSVDHVDAEDPDVRLISDGSVSGRPRTEYSRNQ